MRLQNLSDVHSTWNTKRVENNIDSLPVWQVRHILFGKNTAYNTLLPVASSHLVANAKLALGGNKDFTLAIRSNERYSLPA